MSTEEYIEPELSSDDSEDTAEEQNAYRFTDFANPKYNIISIVGYLAGIKKDIFERSHSSPDLDVYERLDRNVNARIIRNLSIIRTALLKNGREIHTEFRYNMKNINTLPDLIPVDAINQLVEDGINLYRNLPDVNEYIIAINKEISNRINNCKSLFPEWLKWEYIKPLFLMPNGMKREGVIVASKEYNSDWNKYPYQCYINWYGKTDGNVLNSDEKFVRLLYYANDDEFNDMSLVRDVGDIELNNIDSFLRESEKIIVSVDCENSNPIKLAAALLNLSRADQNKIMKILLFDSYYTSAEWGTISGDSGELAEEGETADWNILTSLTSAPIERKTVGRLNEHKSQVDLTLAADTCKEVYKNGADSVILVSSDSDYWALIQSMDDVNFLVMIEREKCGDAMKEALQSKGIHYCYLDSFYTGDSYSIKTKTLSSVIQAYLDSQVKINTKKVMDYFLENTRVPMTIKEQNIFYDKYLKRIRATVSPEGDVRIVLGD